MGRFAPIIYKRKIIGGTIEGVRVQESGLSHERKLTICSGENNFPGLAVLLDGVGVCFNRPSFPADFLQKLWLDVTETLPIPGQIGVSSVLKIEGEYRKGKADFTKLSSLENEGFNLKRPSHNLIEIVFGWISGPDATRSAYLTQEEATEFGKFLQLAEEGFKKYVPFWDKLASMTHYLIREEIPCPHDCIGAEILGCDSCRADRESITKKPDKG